MSSNVLILMANELRKRKKISCDNSFYEFVQYFWDVVIKDPMLKPWYIKYLCDLIQDNVMRVIKGEYKLYDIPINVPPSSSKSTLLCVMMPVWAWTQKQSLRIITSSFDIALALRDSTLSRDIIRSDKFNLMYPDLINIKKDVDSKSYYQNTMGGWRKAVSVGSNITGFHADIWVIDDPLNPGRAASDADKKAINNWLRKTVPSRKINKLITVTFLIMQRLAEDDCTGTWLGIKNKKLFHVCLPSEITELDNVKPKSLEQYYTDGYLDPIRSGPKALEDVKRDMTDREYACQYLQNPAAREGTIYKREYWQNYEVLPQTPILRRFHSWDTAFTKNSANALNACIVAYLYSTGLYLIEVYSKALEFPQLENQVKYLYAAHPADTIIIEDKASGISLLQSLRYGSALPLEGIQPDTDKIARANAATPYCKSGNVYLPSNKPWTKDFVETMAGFPDIKHKDIPDAFSQLIQYILINAIFELSVKSASAKTKLDNFFDSERHKWKKSKLPV